MILTKNHKNHLDDLYYNRLTVDEKHCNDGVVKQDT